MNTIPNKSNVRGLFTHRTTDATLFTKIHWIIYARVAHDRVLMELYLVGGRPPLAWLQTLTCEVRDPATGHLRRAAVEAVRGSESDAKGTHLYVVTDQLSPPLAGETAPSPSSTVRLVSSTGLKTRETVQASRTA